MKNNYDFITIPRVVVQSNKIRDSDRLVYGVIYSIAQMSNKRCTAKNTTIADMAGLSTGSVANSLARLVEAGFIQTTFKDSSKRIRVEIIPNISYNNEVFNQVIKEVSSNDESGVSSNDEQNNNIYNNNIIYNNIYNNIIKELYKINDRIYYIGKTKTQLSALKVLLQMGEQKLGSVERVEQIIEWYVAQYLKLKDQPENFKFFPKALVPTQLLDKWSSIENLYNEAQPKEFKGLW